MIKSKSSKTFAKSFTFKKTGLAPGSVVYVGDKAKTAAKMTLLSYAAGTYTEKEMSTPSDIQLDSQQIHWLQIQGLSDVQLLQEIGEKFNIHSLTLEDIANTRQSAKLEEFDDFIFITLKTPYFDKEQKTYIFDHTSFICKDELVISFQEVDAPHFAHLYKRFANKNARLYKFGPAYLLYALMDLVVDYYFPIIEYLNDKCDFLEEHIINQPKAEHADHIQQLSREIISIKKEIRPARLVILSMLDEDIHLKTDDIEKYLNDLKDHIDLVVGNIETLHELCKSLWDSFQSQMSNKMNEVMKVLTIITTIFIPLSFLAGIYGMNFEFMPELHYKWGYYILLAIMLIIITIMLSIFKRKKWF